MRIRLLSLLILPAALVAQSAPAVTAAERAMLNRVRADALRAHVAFLASDLLEGRATPSRGLDLAAEYIASQLRIAGLEPAGNQGYFQVAKLQLTEPDWEGFAGSVEGGGKRVELDRSQFRLFTTGALKLEAAPVVRLTPENLASAQDLAGKVAFLDVGREKLLSALAQASRMKAALIITADPVLGRQMPVTRLVDPEAGSERGGPLPPLPILAFVSEAPAREALSAEGARLTIYAAAPVSRTVEVKNVAGLIRGSDPQLKETYVMATAHYDHIGVRAGGEDRIANGANDDASGTAGVLEIAAALAAAPVKPKRSVLFVAFFGEETGLLGSRYYGRHPLVPLKQTIGNINLEQIGRTDAIGGPQVRTASFTGFDFSTLPAIFAAAGEATGVKVYKDEKRSDGFFSRSDNQALADIGIPSHTMCVAFEYADYHGVGDEWHKLDYENFEAVTRMVALGLSRMAGDAPPPKWNADNEKAKKYTEAARKLQEPAVAQP
ncbi:MAG: M20/M25/M40 family metallo-hydrolase [Bryobacteraceae bacterium]|nr:M20/M25/M40 family metallo-hydrolase [Bryobacteraceae bacterium]